MREGKLPLEKKFQIKLAITHSWNRFTRDVPSGCQEPPGTVSIPASYC